MSVWLLGKWCKRIEGGLRHSDKYVREFVRKRMDLFENC